MRQINKNVKNEMAEFDVNRIIWLSKRNLDEQTIISGGRGLPYSPLFPPQCNIWNWQLSRPYISCEILDFHWTYWVDISLERLSPTFLKYFIFPRTACGACNRLKFQLQWHITTKLKAVYDNHKKYQKHFLQLWLAENTCTWCIILCCLRPEGRHITMPAYASGS